MRIRLNKILFIACVFLLFGWILNYEQVYAVDDNLQAVFTGMQDSTSFTLGTGKISGVLNTIIGLIQFAGSGISIITVTVLGIKYMMASANEKADLKKQAIPIVIGCVLLFGAVNISNIIFTVGHKLSPSG